METDSQVCHRQRHYEIIGENLERCVVEDGEDDKDVANHGDEDHGAEGQDGDEGLPEYNNKCL